MDGGQWMDVEINYKIETKQHKYIFFTYSKKMIIPIKCFTCGMVLADKYRYYLEEVRKRKRENGLDIEKVRYLTKEFNQKTHEGEVMDELGLTKMCCRRHILTHVDIE